MQQDLENESLYIVESKKKCINDGMDPNELTFSKVILSEQELIDKKMAYEEILEVVSFFSNKILKSLEGTPMVITISDEKGTILEMIGNEVMISTMSQLSIKPGVQFSQEDMGTNVISLTLQQNHPIQLIGTNHYHTMLHNSACYGVPFHYSDDNNLLGAICIMTAIVLHNPFFLMTLDTVVDSIERELILRKQNRKLNIMNQIMLSKTKNGIIITDKEGKITQYNGFTEKISGFSKEQTIGTIVLDSPITGKYFKNVLQNGGIYENFEMKFTNNNGENYVCLFDAQPIHDENMKIIGAFGQFRDITARYLAEEKYNYLAYHDDLTGLPNRRCLIEKLNEYINDNKFSNMAIIFLDLDKFKMINDSFGHSYGDLLITEVAKMLNNSFNEGYEVFRMGGDEFVILCFNIKDQQSIANVAKKITNSFDVPFLVKGNQLHITASTGVVLCSDLIEIENLLVYADNAMYKAKFNGRNGYVIYDSTIEKSYKDKLTLKMSIERAIEKKEFVLYYQPQIDIKNGNIIGVEALIRWIHPKRGIILPDKFIPLAEETGLICRIGEWVLKEACLQMKKWQDAFLGLMKVSVNISTQQFLKNNLIGIIKNILVETELEPQYLELEITESMTMEVDHAIEILNQLNDLGIKISIDDFGTGYSSLSYLKKFAINHLKIDKSFVKDIMTDDNDASIVGTIISMAHNLGLEVVAEGVEDKEQLRFLQLQNCDLVQGYYFSRPMPTDFFAKNYIELQKSIKALTKK